MLRRSPGLTHLVVAAGFVLFGIAWSYPLVTKVSTHIAGSAAGDNLVFLWNFWWARTAFASGVDPFHTTYLFAPVGADLTLHTHTLLPAWIGALPLGSISVVSAHNLLVIAALALNGFSAYLLCWRVTGDRGGAVIGGLVFGGSAYVAGHLQGHFNLVAAWPIPLFALAVLEAIRGSAKWAATAGLILGITAFIDYYYVVYSAALGLCLGALAGWRWSVRWAGRHPSRRLRQVVAGLIAIDVLGMAAIAATGGFSTRLGSFALSARGLFNPMQVLWVLAGIWLYLRWRPRVAVTRVEGRPRFSRILAPLAAMFVLVASPILWHAAAVVARGDYVTQTYFWRSSPSGLDLATLVLGNPFHGLWGDRLLGLYRALGIDAIESTAWLGIVPIILAVGALRRSSGGPPAEHVRTWAVVGLVFFIWALGPHLRVLGVNTGMILPEATLRYLPFVSNARVPGRAVVVTHLALALLASAALAARPRWARGAVPVIAIAVAVMADLVPAPYPLLALDRPALYETLRDRTETGAVCELPLGLRDGFGSRGLLDHRVFHYQTIHGRPIAGGFIARLPLSVRSAYENDPLFHALLDLSEPATDREVPAAPLPDRIQAAARLRENGIAFLVLNRRLASERLIRYVEDVLPLARIAEDESRTLYVVTTR